MKSFCIKTNNPQILEYLQKEISVMPLSDIYYSKNKFKIYSNIIIHYKGTQEPTFVNLFSDIITNSILLFYEDTIISRIINYNYFYFDAFEKSMIKSNCIDALASDYTANYDRKENIWISVFNYLCTVNKTKSFIIDGFVNFRISEYTKYLDTIVDLGVNKFIIDREYNDFINLLKAYIDSKDSTIDLVHLIYTNNSPILLDKSKDLINISTNNIVNTTYLSDISFSACDYILNTLLSLIPDKIIIHLIADEDDFITSLKLIFSSRITICNECDICRTYSLLNKI